MQKGIVRSCFVWKFQAANMARSGDMVYNYMLQARPFISVMLSHFENQII